MKTYESEKKELFDELRHRTEQYFEESKNEVLKNGYYQRDGLACYRYQIYKLEWIKRFKFLKEKYNIK